MRGSLSSPLQLEKNPKLPATTRENPRDFPLNVRLGTSPCSSLRAILSSFSKLERKLECLQATQEVPQDTRRNSRRKLRFPPQLKKSHMFPIHLEMRADSPASTREESRLYPHASRGGLSHLLKLERNPSVPATIRKDAEFPLTWR